MTDEEKDVQPVTESEDTDLSFEEEAAKFEKEHNRQGFEQRKKKGEEGKEDEDMADRVAAKILPVLKAQTEASLLESKLEKLTSDPALQRLVKLHLENTVNPNAGSLDDRLEIAWAAANRKKILKTVSELKTAQANRQQISNNAQGASTDGPTPKSDNTLSESQLKDLQGRGWSKEKIERFKKNLLRNAGR